MTTLDKTALEAAHDAYVGQLPEDRRPRGHRPPALLRALETAITAYLSALPAQPVGVKPLEWRKRVGGSTSNAATPFGPEYVVYSSGPTWWSWGVPGFNIAGQSSTTEDEAKAAAQADYEARIRSAIAAPSRQEGVTEEMVEAAAEAIYEHWQFGKDDPQLSTMKKPAWAPSGNSNRQNEARNYARAALEAALVDRVKP